MSANPPVEDNEEHGRTMAAPHSNGYVRWPDFEQALSEQRREMQSVRTEVKEDTARLSAEVAANRSTLDRIRGMTSLGLWIGGGNLVAVLGLILAVVVAAQ